MKNLKLILSAVAATLVVGCSDLAVNEDTAYAGNLPSNFDYKTYAEINPVLKFAAVTQAVADYNAEYAETIKTRNTLNRDVNDSAASKIIAAIARAQAACSSAECPAVDSLNGVMQAKKDSLAALEATEAVKAYIADSVKFFLTDSASMYLLFTAPWGGSLKGYNDSVWAKSWNVTKDTTIYDTTKTTHIFKLAVVDKSGETPDTTRVYLNTGFPTAADAKGKITYSDTDPTKIAAVEGFTDTTYETPVSVTMDENKSFLPKLRKDTTVIGKIDSTKISTHYDGLDPDKLKDFKIFNFVNKPGDNINDYERAESVELDSTTTTLQYVLVGKLNGWAYRYCDESEITHARACDENIKKCEMMEAGSLQDLCFKKLKCDLYPATKLYCKNKATGYSHEI